jgi:hypothetical protein
VERIKKENKKLKEEAGIGGLFSAFSKQVFGEDENREILNESKKEKSVVIE